MKPIGFSATKTVNGTLVADYATEASTGTSPIGKMITSANELLKRMGVKGTGGVVGTYDPALIGEACHNIYNGAIHADSGYGVILTAQYFQTAKLL